VAEFPRNIPLFPLPNFVLFPGVKVPLHIFEPRYREMVADAEGTDRLIGMMLLKGVWERDYYEQPDAYDRPDVFDLGCAGRIAELIKLPDGRYNMVLEGTAEFRVVRELHGRSYRQAEVEWRPLSQGALDCDTETLEGLRELLFSYLGAPGRDAWHALVEQRNLRGAELINFLCFHLDLTPLEKQTLLEALAGRVDCLLDILSFKLEERKLGPGGPKGGPDTVQ